jgi:hypothetical protein
MQTQAIIHIDFALFWLDMVCLVMACPDYLSLIIFLRYFDHSNIILCGNMDPITKNHAETGKFLYGFCITLLRYGMYSNGLPKSSFF